MEETTGRIVMNEADKTHLKRAAKWAKFIAIVQLIFVGLGIVGAIFMLVAVIASGASFHEVAMMVGMTGLPGIPGMLGMTQMPYGLVVVHFVLMFAALAVSIFLALYLLGFATRTLRALREDNAAVMTRALANLEFYFRLQGIMLIAVFVFVLLVFVAMVVYVSSLG